MAVISLLFDISDVEFSANVTGLRASKRIKSIGGAWDVAGFSPANDFLKTINTVDATVDSNKVYEFKLDALCSGGAISPNLNGIVEQIHFACIDPTMTATHNSITVVIPLAGLDITKARIILKRVSDDVTMGTVIANKIGNNATAVFSGLAASTDYYATVELYAMVGGVEKISSDPALMNAVCTGIAYQQTTSAAPVAVTIAGGVGNSIGGVCASDVTYYIAGPATDISTGIVVYADEALTIPYTGFAFIRSGTGQIFIFDNVTGTVEEVSLENCGGTFEVINEMGAGNSIDDLTPVFWTFDSGTFPVAGGETRTGVHGYNNSVKPITVTITEPAEIQYRVNGTLIHSIEITTSDTYDITDYIVNTGDDIQVKLIPNP